MVTPPPSPDPAPKLNARGEERPAFLLEFPDDPALAPLVEAFEYGNYAKVRKEAAALAQGTADPRVRRAAEDLLLRIEPDPLVKRLLLVAVCLFLFVVAWVYLGAAR
jgi:hypothetical protein